MLLFLFSFLYWPSLLEAFACLTGTLQIGNDHRCLYIGHSAQYYIWAVQQCEGFGGNLAKIESSFQSDFIFGYTVNQLNGMSPYIGVEKMPNGTWLYSDGTPLNYTNWDQNEPNNRTGNVCAIMDGDTTRWKAVDCVTPRTYLCTIEADKIMKCPTGWIYSESLDYCYYLQNFTYMDGVSWLVYNWTSADKNCFLMGGHLVSIHSKAEDDYVSALIRQNITGLPHGGPPEKKCQYSNAWIGLYADGEPGHGTWSDGTPVNYTNSASSISSSSPWMILNTDCDDNPQKWKSYSMETNTARYVCKLGTGTRMISAKIEALHAQELRQRIKNPVYKFRSNKP